MSCRPRCCCRSCNSTLKPRLVGIENGPFVDLAVDAKALAAAESGNFSADGLESDPSEIVSGGLDALTPGTDKPGATSPVSEEGRFAVVRDGQRDDSRQKGYDVLARAAELFLEGASKGRFLFFPIPGDEGVAGLLALLRKLAWNASQNVLVFPFLFREGFLGALRGATYGVMPSLYEPFGMANEFYLNGTVGIGRATGGIVQQIAPLRAAASFGKQVAERTARWHAPSAAADRFSLPREGRPSIRSRRLAGDQRGAVRPQRKRERPGRGTPPISAVSVDGSRTAIAPWKMRPASSVMTCNFISECCRPASDTSRRISRGPGAPPSTNMRHARRSRRVVTKVTGLLDVIQQPQRRFHHCLSAAGLDQRVDRLITPLGERFLRRDIGRRVVAKFDDERPRKGGSAFDGQSQIDEDFSRQADNRQVVAQAEDLHPPAAAVPPTKLELA